MFHIISIKVYTILLLSIRALLYDNIIGTRVTIYNDNIQVIQYIIIITIIYAQRYIYYGIRTQSFENDYSLWMF